MLANISGLKGWRQVLLLVTFVLGVGLSTRVMFAFGSAGGSIDFYTVVSEPEADATPECGLAWRVVSSPNVGTSSNYLYGIASVSANNAWAVGEYFNNNGVGTQTLIEHGDGTQWGNVSGPNPGLSANSLAGAVALSPRDIWAIGSYLTTPGFYRTLIEHWDGMQWNVITSPNGSAESNWLSGIAAVSADDI